MGDEMAVESLAELQRQQDSGVPSLTDLQGQQAAETGSEFRDPVLGSYLPYRTPEQEQWIKRFLLDERDRELFGEVVAPPYWGQVTGSGVRESAEGRIEGYYQMQLGLSPEQVQAARDMVTEIIAQPNTPPEKALDLYREAYRNGQVNVQLADLGLQVLRNQDTPQTWAEIQRLRKQIKGPYDPALLTLGQKMGRAAAEQIPILGETLQAAPRGAAVGGLAGAAAGVFVSAGEPLGGEAAVPALTAAGMKLGAGLAGAYRIGQIEAGGAILDLLDANVDPAVAKAAAWGVGAINGALEMTEIGTLLKTMPGGRMLGHKAMSQAIDRMLKDGTLRNLAAQHAVRFGTYLSAETAQELAQESVSITAEEFSKALTKELGGTPEAYATAAEIRKRLYEVGVQSLEGFTVLGIPGSALSAGVDVVGLRRGSAAVLLPDVRTTEIPAQIEEIPTVKNEFPASAAAVETAAAPQGKGGTNGRQIKQGPQEAVTAVTDQGAAAAAPGPSAARAAARGAAESANVAEPGSFESGETAAGLPPAAIDAAVQGLSYEALKARAREIGIKIKGKKAQLAALISDAIKAKAGSARRTRSERDELRATEQAIKDHPLYQQAQEFGGYHEGSMEVGYENRTRRGLVDPDRTYYVEPKYQGDVESYTGQPRTKGHKGALAARITYDQSQGQAWDQAMQEQGLDGGFDEFMQGLAAAVEWKQTGPGGIKEAVLAEALKADDPVLRMLAAKRDLLTESKELYEPTPGAPKEWRQTKTRASAAEVNREIERIAQDYPDLDRAYYQDLLIGGGMLVDTAEPHPGSLKFKDFLEKLGRELSLPEGTSAWLSQYGTGAAETPRVMYERLRAEWRAVKTQEVAAELNVGQILSPQRKLSRAQEAEIEAVDAEKVADQILQREKETIFGQLIRGVFDDAAELGRLRQALRQAYAAGSRDAIAKAKAAYAAQEAKVKARKQLREQVAKMLRIIHRPAGKSIALAQRLAIQEIQASVDPQFRSARTIAERQAAREYFAQHPDEAPPARVMKVIQSKAFGELSVAEIEEIARAIVALRKQGKESQRQAVEARAVRLEADKRAVYDSVTGGEPLGEDFSKPIVAAPERGAGEARRNLWLHTLTPERLFDWLDRQKNYLGDMFHIFWTRVADAEAGKQRWINTRVAASKAILEKLHLTLQDLAADALDINGETISVQQAIGVRNFVMNLSSRLAVQFGNRMSVADQRRATDLVNNNPALRELADWILDHYTQHYERLYDAVATAENRAMGREDNYMPIRRMELDFTPDSRQLLNEQAQRAYLKRGYAEKGMTLNRQDIAPEYQKPIRLDAYTLLLEQIERQEHYIAFASLVRDLQAVVHDEGVQNALRDRGGRDVQDLVQHYVDAVGNPNIYRTYGLLGWFLRRMRQHTAIAYLGAKLSTVLKQPVSVMRYLPYAGLNLVKSGLEYVANPTQIRAFCVERDPLLESPALERELQELRQADPNGYERIVQAVGKIGFKPIEWTDSVARTVGWYGVYLQEMQAHGDETRAIEQARLATSLSQAGARAFQLPELYRTSDYVNVVLQFTNELNKLWNIESYDLPMLLRNGNYERAFKMFVGVGIEASIMWMFANRSIPDEPKDLADLFLTEAIGAVPVFGPAIVGAVKGFGGLDIPIVEVVSRAAAGLYRLGNKALDEGTADSQAVLKAANALLQAVCVAAGIPYTGPRDVVRTVRTGEFSHLIGAPLEPPQRKTKAAARARARRERRSGG